MHGKGYPRSVVTYSTLISACERVGQWRRALDLFAEMRPDGCAPNTVTFNSLIKACAQGGQWEKALELFEAMGGEGCRPDVVTFTALINACDKGGQWRTALAMFERMRSCGCKPDSIVYNAVIDCLWWVAPPCGEARSSSAGTQGNLWQSPWMPCASEASSASDSVECRSFGVWGGRSSPPEAVIAVLLQGNWGGGCTV